MDKKDETMDQFGGQTLPGTGGDYIDESDVEGHRASTQKAVDDGAGPEGLYRGGPTTQGEVIRRGPGKNPNGDR